MRRGLVSIVGVIAMLSLVTAAQGEDLKVPIVVSPGTINLQSQGTWVTVHAEIPIRIVNGITVELDGIPVKVVYADNRGELVAKFIIGDVKDIVEPGYAELTLRGVTLDGGTFVGSDTVKVVDVSGKR